MKPERSIRIWRTPFSRADHDETINANAAYTDEVLAGIVAQGFNAVWVHGLLRGMVPSRVFPELGTNAAAHLRNMRELIVRAGRHGVAVYVYLQPPRGLPVGDPFWKHHPDAGGRTYRTMDPPEEIRCFCTSVPAVKAYVRDSTRRIFEELPGLAGLVLITASEYPAHCYSHYSYVRHGNAKALGCPRCAERHPVEVVAELIHLVRDGVRGASATADVVVWNWSWNLYEPNPCPTIIRDLPADVILMADFERGGRKEILGQVREIDEYSLSYVGPSETFRKCARLAAKRGLQTMAKLQIGTTHELATVPNLPLIGNLYEKARALRRLKINSFMGCWNFGNRPSANTVAFNRFWTLAKLPARQQALLDFAKDYFPGCRAEAVVAAWLQFAAAMDNYPFCFAFIYVGPINHSLSLPMFPRQARKTPVGPSWMDVKRGEWVESEWLDGFTWVEVRRSLALLHREWKRGLARLREGLKSCSDPHAREELDNAAVIYHVLRSTWNTYRFFKLRKHWDDRKLESYRKIARNELANLQEVLPILEQDERFGWHGEPQFYMFDAASVKRKLRQLRRQLG